MKNRKKILKAREREFKWIQREGMYFETPCPNCGEKKVVLIYPYDAKACTACDEWLDPKCEDPNCSFCASRPDSPYEVYWRYYEDQGTLPDARQRKDWRRDNYAHKEDGRMRHERRYKPEE